MASLPGPSSTPYNWQNKETDNFSRLCQLIVTICSDLFRDILSHYIQPSNLRAELVGKKNTLDKVINPQQKQLLYPGKGKASPVAKDLDFSVLYVLLRNICSIPPHKKGWGNSPEPSDVSIAAYIDKIRIHRNLISGHSKSGSMDNASFNNYWMIIADSIIEIEKQLIGGDKYKREVNALYLCELSPSSTKRYVEEITQTFQSEIAKKKARIDGVESQLNKNNATKKARLDNMEDQQHSVTQEIRESVSDAETCILSFLQGKFSALEEKIEGRLSALEENIEGRFIGMEQKLEGTLSIMEQKMEDALDRLILLPSASLTLTFDTATLELAQISHVKSGTLWVIDKIKCEVIQVDTNGTIIEKVDSQGPYCVTEDGALLYTAFDEDEDDDEDEYVSCIKKKTSQTTVEFLKTENFENVFGIHCSLINGHILVLLQKNDVTEHCFKIKRYNKYGLKKKDMDIDERVQGRLYMNYNPHIRENRNGDIIISGVGMKAVVGINRSGGYRFKYSHPREKTPKDICTDTYRHILVAYNTSIHLLDEDGIFKKTLLRNISGKDFTSLCLGEKQHLYIGTKYGVIKVYKYLKDE